MSTKVTTKPPELEQGCEVTDSGLLQELVNSRVSRIASGQTEHIWMAVPELISWDNVSGFRLPTRGRTPQYPDIHLEHFVECSWWFGSHN